MPSHALAVTIPTLILALVALFAQTSLGICLPCQPELKRSTPWDYGFNLSTRDVYSPTITNPTYNTVWVTGSEVVTTWSVYSPLIIA